jgi:hypothetical protein
VGSAPTSGPQNTIPGWLNWMSATVLTSRDAGSSPVPGTQFRERCQSPAYWGVLLRRWPFTGPGGSNPFLSARRRHPSVVRDDAGDQATGCASRLGGQRCQSRRQSSPYTTVGPPSCPNLEGCQRG